MVVIMNFIQCVLESTDNNLHHYVENRVVKLSKIQTSIYKFEFGFQIFAIRFVLVIAIRRMYLTSGRQAETRLCSYLIVMVRWGMWAAGMRVGLVSLILMGVKPHFLSSPLQPSFTLKKVNQPRSEPKVACYGQSSSLQS